MTTIKYGDQHNEATSHHEIVSDGGTSKISFGKQFDHSKLTSRVFDLANPSDLAGIAQHLATFSAKLEVIPEAEEHPEDVTAIKDAAQSAANGDSDGFAKALQGVGKWILKTGTEIGEPILVDILKSYLK